MGQRSVARRDDRRTRVTEAAPVMREAYVPRSTVERWGPGVLISLATVIAYIPSLDNKFVSWDDDHYLYNNQQVILPDGIRSGLFDVYNYSNDRYRGKREEKRVSHQFYPLVFGTYWLEYRLYEALFDKATLPDDKFWKMNPDVATGFHATSVLLHCVNVFLLIALLRSLGINTWVAGVAAALFALTPVNVASVAWAAERKNILSLMFYLLAMMSYVRFRRGGRWPWYVGCLVLFQCALFSKTVALTFPVMVVLTDRLLDGRWTLISLARAAPMVVLSGIAAKTTILVEDRGRTIPIIHEQRPLVAASAIWFYVSKSLIPVKLLPIYPLWMPSWAQLRWVAPVPALLVPAWALWHWRRRIPGHAWWAMALFLVTQGPMLGFRDINYFQFAFVADHYFYNSGIGLLVLWALAGDALRRRMALARVPVSLTVLAAAMSLTFGVLTWQRCNDWQDADSFWATTLAGNPNCWPAYYNLANQRFRDAGALREKDDTAAAEKKVDEAIELYVKAIDAYHATSPAGNELWQAFENVIKFHLGRGRYVEAEKYSRRFLSRYPGHGEATLLLGMACEPQGKTDEAYEAYVRAARALAAVGKYLTAASAYRKSIGLNPDRIENYLALADLLGGLKRYDEAVQWCRKALERNPNHPQARQALDGYERRRTLSP